MKSNAGPDLDSQVARLLFGTVVIIDTQSGDQYMMGRDRVQVAVPPYSTDMESAEEITDFMQTHDHVLSMKKAKTLDVNRWSACFSKADTRSYVASYAATAAEAVCVAALDALKGLNVYQGVKAI
jgi:hypothetical protein